jgi:hypothetical protein
MGREKISGARCRQRKREGLSGLGHEAQGAFQQGESRMPFIQMADIRFEPEGGQQSPAPDPKRHFLLQAQFLVAAIKFAGDAPMDRKRSALTG